MREIKATEINENLIKMIGTEAMIIAAGDEKKYNMMTASWGFMGQMWGKPSAAVVVRPQRYTMEFLEKHDTFSLSFLGDNPEIYKILGTTSGRDTDKSAATDMYAEFGFGAPVFEKSRLTVICKKLYVQRMEKECFIDKSPLKWYPEEDYHYVIIGEIEKVLEK